jgi:hypothetical protein
MRQCAGGIHHPRAPTDGNREHTLTTRSFDAATRADRQMFCSHALPRIPSPRCPDVSRIANSSTSRLYSPGLSCGTLDEHADKRLVPASDDTAGDHDTDRACAGDRCDAGSAPLRRRTSHDAPGEPETDPTPLRARPLGHAPEHLVQSASTPLRRLSETGDPCSKAAQGLVSCTRVPILRPMTINGERRSNKATCRPQDEPTAIASRRRARATRPAQCC